eukprot:422275-Rhodomonas_salina.1
MKQMIAGAGEGCRGMKSETGKGTRVESIATESATWHLLSGLAFATQDTTSISGAGLEAGAQTSSLSCALRSDTLMVCTGMAVGGSLWRLRINSSTPISTSTAPPIPPAIPAIIAVLLEPDEFDLESEPDFGLAPAPLT